MYLFKCCESSNYVVFLGCSSCADVEMELEDLLKQ